MEPKKPVSQTKWRGKMEIPLSKGYSLESSAKVKKWSGLGKKITWPFKTRKSYLTSIISFVVIISALLLIINFNSGIAATYYWVQNTWIGGQSANNAAHPSDATGWDEYSTKDSTITAGAAITITPIETNVSQTNDTDFGAGTTSSTVISGTGSGASVELDSVSLDTNNVATSRAVHVQKIGDYVHVADAIDGYHIVDVSDPTTPTVEDTYDTPSVPAEVAVYGNYAYVADNTTLQIIDFSTPNSLSLAGSYDCGTGYRHNAVYIEGTTLYLGCGYDPESDNYWKAELWILDLSSDPTDPTKLGSVQAEPATNTGIPYGIHKSGNYVYMSAIDPSDGFWNINFFHRFDVTTPGSPTWENYWTESASGAASVDNFIASGNYVYMAAAGYGIRVFDISNPAIAPSQTDTQVLGRVSYGIDVVGTTAYVGQQSDGIELVDVSDPNDISIITTYDTPGSAFDVNVESGYAYIGDYGSGVTVMRLPGYVASGTFTSSAIDTTANIEFNAISWNSTEPGSTSISLKARTSNDSGMSGAPAWGTCGNLTSGNDISSDACVSDGHQYIQYQATLTTPDAAVTPSFDDITVNYNYYPASQTLTSSAYNTGSSANVFGDILWNQSSGSEPSNTDIKFQVRTAPDSGGSPGTWTSWMGYDDGADPTLTFFTQANGGQAIPSDPGEIGDGSDDQWIQYQATLETSDGSVTPTLGDVSMIYVVNAPPEFENTITAAQQTSDGQILITYSVRDPDGSSGAGTVTPSFEYSINGGGAWNPITSGYLSAGATTAKSVDDSSYTQYQTIWDAKSQIDGTYTIEAQIRVTVDDGEGANNTAVSNNSDFTLDVKDPALGSNPLLIDATVNPAAITLDATDDSTLEMRISLNNDMSGSSYVAYNSSTTISLVTDPDTVYAQFKDNYQNTTTIQSVITPETPDKMVIRDLSNVDAPPSWIEFISWRSVSVPDVDFAAYRIYHSTDGISYSLLYSETDRSRNYYLHSGLTQDSVHYYKLYTETNDGNKSYFSSVVSDTVDGQGGTDSTPPSISNVSITNINTQSATITWDTDELSDSTVGYSTTAADFSNETGSATMYDTDAGVGQHSLTITDLIPNTTYYVQVKSDDPSSNTSTDNNGGDGYSFSTLAGPAISNVTPSSISNTKVTITWLTDINSPSSIFYSTNSDLSGATEMTVAESVTEHSLQITELTQGTRYYYYVKSDVAINNNGGAYYNFITTQDSTSPVISGIASGPVTDTQSVIQWNTNEKSTSQIIYGTKSGTLSKSTTTDTSLNVLHTITINNLTPKTKYFYKVISIDDSGNSSTSTEKTFTTLEELSEETEVISREELARLQNADEIAPSLSNIVISEITSSGAKLSWDTNEDANSFVQFGLTNTYSKIYGNWLYDTEHEITLDGLQRSTEYHFRVISADKGGNIVNSEDATFTTTATGGDSPTLEELNNEIIDLIEGLDDDINIESLEESISTQQQLIDQISELIPSPLIRGEPRVDTTATTAVISWSTDKLANTIVAYATDSFYNPELPTYEHVAGDVEDFNTSHVVTITNLEPNTTYHYQIRNKGEVSGYTTSADFTFTTDRKSFGIENYTVDKITNEKAIFRWVTTESSNSKIIYMPYRNNVRSVEEAKTLTDDINTLIHQIQVDDLESGITYYVELESTDADGEITNKIINTFTTNDEDTPPIITQVQTDSALSPGGQAKVQTIISWTTNELATSRVFFRKGVAEAEVEMTEFTQLDPNYTKNHVIIITDFDPGSVYQFRAESTDSSGLTTLSQPITILTPQEEQTVFEVIFGAVEDAFGWLRVFSNQ